MAELDGLITANRRYAAAFDRAGDGAKPGPPARKLAILCCMDARMQPEAFLGLGLGDAHVIRNAGGRASDDALRSLVISTHLLGTREIIVIHHTQCGMMSFSNDDLRAQLRRDLGADATGVDFLPFADLDQSVRDDVQTIRSSLLLPRDITVAGMVYDVRTGEVRVVAD